jgi:glutathione synthase/RimK-type ligase-like ATP-grasp enzyme
LKILIHAIPADVHIRAVRWGLEQDGCSVDSWMMADLPEIQVASIRISNQMAQSVDVSGSDLSIEGGQYDVVWQRRLGAPSIDPGLSPADQAVALQEVEEFSRSLLRAVGRGAFWVNSLDSRALANRKPLQLSMAVECGLKIPETLVSNSSVSVQEFYNAHASKGEVIVKPFLGATWVGETKSHFYTTAIVTADDLSDPESIRLCPAIYQNRIEKQYEVRLTIMGRSWFAARLNSQGTPSASLDWRVSPSAYLDIARIDVPGAVVDRCFALMQQLGIVFGCFDFAVTRDNEYVFFEVNEMGQFLWVEELAPQIPLLDAFCRFLQSGNPNFEYREDARSISWRDFQAGFRAADLSGELNLHRPGSRGSPVIKEATGERIF